MGHKHKMTDAAHVRNLVSDGVSVARMAEAFGVGAGAIHNWIRKDSAPFWTHCACLALTEGRNRGGKRIVICTIQKKFVETLVIIVKAHGGSIHVVGE